MHLCTKKVRNAIHCHCYAMAKRVYRQKHQIRCIVSSFCLLAAVIPTASSAAQDDKNSFHEAQGIPLGSLPGRPLLTRAGESTKLIPAGSSSSVRGENGGRVADSSYMQYLIRTTNPPPVGMLAQIQLAAQGHAVHYMPEVRQFSDFSMMTCRVSWTFMDPRHPGTACRAWANPGFSRCFFHQTNSQSACCRTRGSRSSTQRASRP